MMINWRGGKGGFVGGIKTLIKGVFQFAYSKTSVAPVGPTPDCFVTFIGTITERTMSDAVFIGTLTDTKTLIGTLNADDKNFDGTMTDENALIGDLCND
jgi:hypothetical protein